MTLEDGSEVTIECKDASPRRYANGNPKVEIQKTRASRGDPLSRLYKKDAFGIIAACMYGPSGEWTFEFKRTADLRSHPDHSDRVNPLQRIDETWSDQLDEVLGG